MDIATRRDPLLTAAQVSAQIGVKPETLEVWRSTRRYPLDFVKVGKLVRYRQSAVDRFLSCLLYTSRCV